MFCPNLSTKRLYLYLAVTNTVASVVLVRVENDVWKAVYYVSKRLVDAESMYPAIEKLGYSLVLAS